MSQEWKLEIPLEAFQRDVREYCCMENNGDGTYCLAEVLESSRSESGEVLLKIAQYIRSESTLVKGQRYRGYLLNHPFVLQWYYSQTPYTPDLFEELQVRRKHVAFVLA